MEGAWLTAAYAMVNLSANLIIFKMRQQYGIRRFTEIALMGYLGITLLHLFVDDYATTLLVRGVSGFVAAPLSSLGVYYTMQGFPKKKLGNSLVVAFGFSQLSLPIAWLLSPALLDLGNWQTLYMFEFGLTLCALAAIVSLKLPPGIRIKVIEPADFLTFALTAPALGLVAAVLAQGRVQWWTEQPWMAIALVAALALLVAAFFVEHHRVNPLIHTRWLGTSEVAVFVFAALAFRLILSEQSFAAATMLRTLGMGPDQFQLFYLVMIAGIVAGTALGTVAFGPKTVLPMLLVAIVLVIVGSLVDSDATSQTRPHDMMTSQFLLGFAGALIMAPLILTGVTKALARGSDHIVTFVVLFTMTQTLGGLLGPAIYGTAQQVREHEYSGQMTANVDPADPVVAQRLAIQRQIFANQITDPALRQAQGMAQLQQIATREANVRAFNDVFVLNAIIASLFLLWSVWRAIVLIRAARASASAASAGTAM